MKKVFKIGYIVAVSATVALIVAACQAGNVQNECPTPAPVDYVTTISGTTLYVGSVDMSDPYIRCVLAMDAAEIPTDFGTCVRPTPTGNESWVTESWTSETFVPWGWRIPS